jgi:hypothetical protein
LSHQEETRAGTIHQAVTAASLQASAVTISAKTIYRFERLVKLLSTLQVKVLPQQLVSLAA